MLLSRVNDMLQCGEGTNYKQWLQVQAMTPCSVTFVLYPRLFQPSFLPYTMNDIMSLNMSGELLMPTSLEEGPMTHYSSMLQYLHIFTYRFMIIHVYLSRWTFCWDVRQRFEKCVFEGFRWNVGKGGDNKHLTYNDSYAGVYACPFAPLVSGFA